MTEEDGTNTPKKFVRVDPIGPMSVKELADELEWSVEDTIALLIKSGYTANTTAETDIGRTSGDSFIGRVAQLKRYGELIDSVNPPAPTIPIEDLRDSCTITLNDLGCNAMVMPATDDRDRPFFRVLCENDPSELVDVVSEHFQGYVILLEYMGSVHICKAKV